MPWAGCDQGAGLLDQLLWRSIESVHQLGGGGGCPGRWAQGTRLMRVTQVALGT